MSNVGNWKLSKAAEWINRKSQENMAVDLETSCYYSYLMKLHLTKGQRRNTVGQLPEAMTASNSIWNAKFLLSDQRCRDECVVKRLSKLLYCIQITAWLHVGAPVPGPRNEVTSLPSSTWVQLLLGWVPGQGWCKNSVSCVSHPHLLFTHHGGTVVWV